MKHFEHIDEDRLLMSDSLQGVMPSEEQQIKAFEESIIIVGIQYRLNETTDLIAGSVTGISFEENAIKIDFRKSTVESYKFLKLCLENVDIMCNSLYLQNNEEEIILKGSYKILNPRLTDLDHKEKTCTISLDLVKIAE